MMTVKFRFICCCLMFWRRERREMWTFSGTSSTFTTSTVSRAEINHVNMTRDNTQHWGMSGETVVTSLFCPHQMFIIRKFIILSQNVHLIFITHRLEQTFKEVRTPSFPWQASCLLMLSYFPNKGLLPCVCRLLQYIDGLYSITYLVVQDMTWY